MSESSAGIFARKTVEYAIIVSLIGYIGSLIIDGIQTADDRADKIESHLGELEVRMRRLEQMPEHQPRHHVNQK